VQLYRSNLLKSTAALMLRASLAATSHRDLRPHLLAPRGVQCHVRVCCERDGRDCEYARTAVEGHTLAHARSSTRHARKLCRVEPRTTMPRWYVSPMS
jgi:hypothetical protein